MVDTTKSTGFVAKIPVLLLIATAAIVFAIGLPFADWNANWDSRPTSMLRPLGEGRLTAYRAESYRLFGSPPFSIESFRALRRGDAATAIYKLGESEFLTLRCRMKSLEPQVTEFEFAAHVRASTPRDAAIASADGEPNRAIISRIRGDEFPGAVSLADDVAGFDAPTVFVDREHIFVFGTRSDALISRRNFQHVEELHSPLFGGVPSLSSIVQIDSDHFMFNLRPNSGATEATESTISRRDDGSVWTNGAFSWLVKARIEGRTPYVVGALASVGLSIAALLWAIVQSLRIASIRKRALAHWSDLVTLENDGTAILKGETIKVEMRPTTVRSVSLGKGDPVSVLLNKTSAKFESGSTYRTPERRTLEAIAILPGDSAVAPFALDTLQARTWTRAIIAASLLLVLARVIIFDIP